MGTKSTGEPYWRYRQVIGAVVCAMALTMLASPALAQSARRDLARIRNQIQQELRARPEMRVALQEWASARAEYQALRRAVIYELNRDSAYLGLRAKMWSAEDELAELQSRYRNGVVPVAEVHRLALEIMELRKQMTALENEAIARHRDLLEAREAYVEAGRRIAELRREMGILLRSDPRFQQALDRLRRGSNRGAGVIGPGSGGGGGRP